MMRSITIGTMLALALLGEAGSTAAEEAITKGTFEGASGHATAGTVTIHRTGGRTEVVLGEDFSLDGAPDPKLGFGNDGTYDSSSTFAVLGANTGSQSYDLPAEIDPGNYDELYVWCEKFSVPLGVAKLQ